MTERRTEERHGLTWRVLDFNGDGDEEVILRNHETVLSVQQSRREPSRNGLPA